MMLNISKAWYFIRYLIFGSLTELSSHCVSLGGVISQAIFQMHEKEWLKQEKGGYEKIW